jgi:hypothetical protein
VLAGGSRQSHTHSSIVARFHRMCPHTHQSGRIVECGHSWQQAKITETKAKLAVAQKHLQEATDAAKSRTEPHSKCLHLCRHFRPRPISSCTSGLQTDFDKEVGHISGGTNSFCNEGQLCLFVLIGLTTKMLTALKQVDQVNQTRDSSRVLRTRL